MEDVRPPVVAAADARGHVVRDRNEVVHAGAGAPVPPPERGSHARHDRARERAAAGPRAEVIIVEIPDVAHRRGAVADVERTGWNAHAPGHAVARRQPEVVTAEGEAP